MSKLDFASYMDTFFPQIDAMHLIKKGETESISNVKRWN